MANEIDNFPPNLKAIGVCWYTPETYAAVRKMSHDTDNFFDTFDEWLASAESKLLGQEYRSVSVVRVHVDPAELLAFCRANNTEVDGRSRSSFASHKVALGHEKEK
jgi:hypothetical protein